MATRIEATVAKIADEVLEGLRRDRNLEEIRTKFRNSSQIYEGLRTFIELSEKLAEETNAAIRETAEKLSEKKAESKNIMVGKPGARAKHHDRKKRN